jgi:hypothetical protein
MLLIWLQTLIQGIRFFKDSSKLQDLDSFLLGKTTKATTSLDTKNIGISATSVSEVTGIPRANCIRKLEKYIEMKIIEKNSTTKRYNIMHAQMKFSQSSGNSVLDGIKHTIDIFSDFSSTVLKSLNKNR